MSSKKTYTLESLSKQLALRVNTIWAFKHKVIDRINDLERTGEKPTSAVWDKVILIPKKHKAKEKQIIQKAAKNVVP